MQPGRHRVSVVTVSRPGARHEAPGGRSLVALAAVLSVVLAAVAVQSLMSAPVDETPDVGLPATAVSAVDASPRLPFQGTGGRGEEAGPRRWVEMLERLDRRRSRAWSRGEPWRLTSVYAAHTPELARDRAALRAYLSRGLRVDGVSLRYAAVDVVRSHQGWVRLRVVDQLSPVRVVTADDVGRWLPRDRPSRHLIELRREPAGWRIATVVVT